MKLIKDERLDHIIDYKRKKNLSYLFIGVFITLIWLIVLGIKIITAVKSGSSLSEVWNIIVNGIFDNILGILPPIIFFDLLLVVETNLFLVKNSGVVL